MAELNDISCYKGEAVALTFTMTPLTDITGWTIAFTVRNNATDAVALLSKAATLTTPLSGIFTVNLTSTETKTTLGTGTFAYDAQRTDPASEAVLSIGTLDIVQEVLYP